MPKLTPGEYIAGNAYADALIEARGWGHDEALDFGLELSNAAEREIYPPAWDHDWPIVLSHMQKLHGAIDKRNFTGCVSLRLLERAPRLP
jgi:hypothetical protein